MVRWHGQDISCLFSGCQGNLYGAKVLCIDLDQQGNLTQALRVNPEEYPAMIDIIREGKPIDDAIVSVDAGLDLVSSRIENATLDNAIILGKHSLSHVYKKLIDPLKTRYDLIIIDCPPALGQSVAAVALVVDEIVSPVTPEKFCLSGLKTTTQELNGLEESYGHKINMRIAVNKFDSRTSLSHEVLSTLIKHPIYGTKMYKTYVRINQDFPNAIAKGQSIFDNLKITTAKEDIDLLTRELLEIVSPSENKNAVSLGTLEEIGTTEELLPSNKREALKCRVLIMHPSKAEVGRTKLRLSERIGFAANVRREA